MAIRAARDLYIGWLKPARIMLTKIFSIENRLSIKPFLYTFHVSGHSRQDFHSRPRMTVDYWDFTSTWKL